MFDSSLFFDKFDIFIMIFGDLFYQIFGGSASETSGLVKLDNWREKVQRLSMYLKFWFWTLKDNGGPNLSWASSVCWFSHILTQVLQWRSCIPLVLFRCNPTMLIKHVKGHSQSKIGPKTIQVPKNFREEQKSWKQE